MGWSWKGDTGPSPAGVLDRQFPSQGEAESWLGEFYPDLLEAGVEAVSLYEEDRLVYGPMKLEPDL